MALAYYFYDSLIAETAEDKIGRPLTDTEMMVAVGYVRTALDRDLQEIIEAAIETAIG